MPRPSASSGGALRIRAGARALRQLVLAGVGESQRHDRSRATARRTAAGLLRDRLPDARQRLRGRGRGAGSAAAGGSGTPGRRADRLPTRVRRERYFGEWLPEPIITDGDDDPARHAETADSLSLAMLVLLESLSPEQRAVLLLHDMFDY